MQALIQFFIELCVLRRAPQDLPASDALLALTIAANLLVGLLVGSTADLPLGTSLMHGLLEIALTLGALYLALGITRHPARFTQSATALLGSGAVVGLVAVIPMTMNATGSNETDTATLGAILLLGLIVWSVVVTGHILRHTFAITLGQGSAIALAFELFAISLIGGLSGTA